MPIAVAFAAKGVKVVGFDLNKAKEILETAATTNSGVIRKLHDDNLISRKKIGPHNKMGYTLSYKGLKALNEAEKALRK